MQSHSVIFISDSLRSRGSESHWPCDLSHVKTYFTKQSAECNGLFSSSRWGKWWLIMDSSHPRGEANGDSSDWSTCSSRVKPIFHLSIVPVPLEDILLQVRKPTKNPDFCFRDFPLPITEGINNPFFAHSKKRHVKNTPHSFPVTGRLWLHCLSLAKRTQTILTWQLHSTNRFPLY